MAWILLKNQIAFLLMMLSGKFDHNFPVLYFPFPHTYLCIPLSKIPTLLAYITSYVDCVMNTWLGSVLSYTWSTSNGSHLITV